MGLIRFQLPNSDRIVLDRFDMIYMAGIDGTPMKCSIFKEGSEIRLERSTSDSGKIYFPVHTEDDHILLIPTGTVVEREKPYFTTLEIARGLVDRTRNQFDVWERFGFEFTDEIGESIQSLSLRFCAAASCQDQPDRCNQHSEEVVDLGLQAIRAMCDQYSEQVIKLRQEHSQRLPTLAATSLDASLTDELEAYELTDLFNTVHVRIDWADYEPKPGTFEFDALIERLKYYREQRLRIILGPAVRIAEKALPDSLLHASDFELVRRRLGSYVTALIDATKEYVDVYELFGGLNSIDDMRLPIDYQLRLAIDAIEAARNADDTTPMLLGVDQPWSEGSTREETISPLQCADAIVRADLDLSGFRLDLNWGVFPSGTCPRDQLQIHNMLDSWAQFELPILISMSMPSANDVDAKALRSDEFVDEGTDSANQEGRGERRQRESLELMMQVLFSKPFIQGVIWNQLSDALPHRFRNCGLFDSEGQPKPAAESWRNLRKEFLT